MSVGILLTNAHLAGSDNQLPSGATLTLASGSTLVLGSSQAANALLESLTSPAKGSIAVRGASTWALLAVGSNGTVLEADSTQASGVKWASSSTAGFVTNTGGALTANALVLGAGTNDTKVAAGLVTDGVSVLTLGVAGGAVGGLVLKNATSGTITINPATGALGSVTITVPAVTGTLLTTAAAVTAAQGGTGQSSYTVGDMLYASTTTALSKLAAVAVGQMIISQGTGTAPVWSSTGRLGILNLLNTTTSPGSGAGGTELYFANVDGTQNNIFGDASGSTAGFNIVGRSCGGTYASPSNTAINSILLFIGARGYANGAYTTNMAQLQMVTSGTWGNTDFSTSILLAITPAASTTATTVFTLTGASLALTVPLTTSSTTDSTSLTTGSGIFSGGLGVAKTIIALHYGGGGTAPTAVVGTGAGTSPSAVTVAGHDAAGNVSVTTGTLPTATGVVLTLTFNTTYGSAPFVTLQPANAATALLSGATMVFVTSGSTTFVITAGATGLVAATTYSWNYSVHQ